ncbi:hypothetical protein JAAARDRAFT_176772 [Jaapia argillacea MUCL 33604]|uniref:DUF155 domain-containing protein n=1 Tax=Jaapia argillacea MUCL 33604 TaxID=933084 RepID=A0A067PV58_9AGAM|nr:hypothetical protein JAAARDRAFT_176772 [Jaapia argillacea MUCL 33604]
MSRPIPTRSPSTPLPTAPRLNRTRSARVPVPAVTKARTPTTTTPRRGSISGLTSVTGTQKAQRTSKTSQKLVVLPSAPQTRPLPQDDYDGDVLGYETDAGYIVRDYKNEGERMSKEQRKKKGFKRITAYCVCEGLKMKLLASFLKREHNVLPRVFDEAMYVMYHLPLLPGYGPNSNIRSSAIAKSPGGTNTIFVPVSEAEVEDNGYVSSYFPNTSAPVTSEEGRGPEGGYFSSSSSPEVARAPHPPTRVTDFALPQSRSGTDGEREQDEERERERGQDMTTDGETEGEAEIETTGRRTPRPGHRSPQSAPPKTGSHSFGNRPSLINENIAEAIFFAYGVVVFFGLEEGQEMSILEDIENAGVMKGKFGEDDWEVEEFHYVHDPDILYPRIYNDFFTFKHPSHFLTLSVSHALAQSTLLAHYETLTTRTLSAPRTLSIPKQLALHGSLQLKRTEALKLTGRLFKLRRDVNLVGNVLDVPELFWDGVGEGGGEGMRGLYDAVRGYMELGGRVGVLNEKLGVASDLLDAIHDHLNNSAMERITWIIIWLIVVACLVELGEVIARLVVHATMGGKAARRLVPTIQELVPLSREEALRTLERMMK